MDSLSSNLVNIILDFQQKYEYIGDKVYEYTLKNDTKVRKKENKINLVNFLTYY